jgi:hypothetical protein
MNIDDETTGTVFSGRPPYDCIESRQHSPARIRGVLLGVVTLGTVWAITATNPGTAEHPRSSVPVRGWTTQEPSADGPGASVYRQQVPSSNWTDQVPWSYQTGGSVYRSQVPARTRIVTSQGPRGHLARLLCPLAASARTCHPGPKYLGPSAAAAPMGATWS